MWLCVLMARWACLWLCVSGWIKVRHVNDKRVDDIPVCHHSHPISFPLLHVHTHTHLPHSAGVPVTRRLWINNSRGWGFTCHWPLLLAHIHTDRGVHSLTGPSPITKLAQWWPLHLISRDLLKSKVNLVRLSLQWLTAFLERQAPARIIVFQ